MHADEPDRRYGHEIQNLSFVMRIALGMERPGAERSFENKRTVRCFYEYKPRSRNRSGPEMDIGHHGRFQRMDAAAGNTGSCAPKRGYGSATVLQDIL